MTSFRKRNMPPFYWALIRKIALIIIVVSIIPLVLVSSSLYLQFRSSYREKVYAHLRELVHKHAQNIDSFLNQRMADVRFLARSFGYEALGNETFLQEKLATLQQKYGPVFVDLGVINAAGEQVAYAGPFKLARARYAEADWFQKTVQKKRFISDVFLGFRGLPHFIVAVQNIHGSEPWILRATIDFERFNSLVENIRIGETGFAFILNKQGILQTTSVSGLKLIPPDDPIYKEFLERPPANQGKVQIEIRPDDSGVDHLYATIFLKNNQWLLVYQQRAADAFADLNRSFAITTVLMILGVCSVVAMAVTLSWRTVDRIRATDEEKRILNHKVIQTGKLALVGELAAGVAHEINNPVAIMVEEAGWIGDLLEEDPDCSQNLDEFHRALDQIKNQGKRCKDITQKLLSFARKSDGAVQDVNINDLLEELLALSAQRAKFGLVEVKTDYQTNLPHVQVSLSELQQVFLNLINNAIDSMEKAGGVLNVATRSQGDCVVVTIADTGTGIPAANLNRIFYPFFTTKPVGKGTGLGLSICYGIIEKVGGRIEIESEVDVGTTFSVHFPIGNRRTGTTEKNKVSSNENMSLDRLSILTSHREED
jgi:two-component system NtrC family sensor kinase